MTTDPNDSAYPLIESNETCGETFFVDTSSSGGLTKREYFTGLALQGILANSNLQVCEQTTVNNGWHHPGTVASLAVQIADAVIESLNEKK